MADLKDPSLPLNIRHGFIHAARRAYINVSVRPPQFAVEDLPDDPATPEIKFEFVKLTKDEFGYLKLVPRIERLGLMACTVNAKTLTELAEILTLKELDLSSCRKLTADCGPALALHQSLEVFELDGKAEVECLLHLKEIPALRHLTFFEVPLTDELVKSWIGHPNLRVVKATYPRLSREAAAAFRQMEELTGLHLINSGWSDEEVSQLAGHPGLTSLELASGKLTDAIGPTLATFASLESLNLRFNKLTGQVLPHVASLQNLRLLNICGMKLKDQDAAVLGSFPELEQLEMDKGVFSSEGYKTLNQGKPKLKIVA